MSATSAPRSDEFALTEESGYQHPYPPVFLKDPVVDALLHVTLELGSELWAFRSRVKLLEAVVADAVAPGTDVVEARFEDDPDLIYDAEERNAFVRRVFGELARMASVRT